LKLSNTGGPLWEIKILPSTEDYILSPTEEHSDADLWLCKNTIERVLPKKIVAAVSYPHLSPLEDHWKTAPLEPG